MPAHGDFVAMAVDHKSRRRPTPCPIQDVRQGRGTFCMLLVASTIATIAGFLVTGADGRRIRDLEMTSNSINKDEFSHVWCPHNYQPHDTEAACKGSEAMMPRFAEPIPNVTVTIGKDALLACVVENLRGYKVAWVRVDTQTILSIHHNVITQNPRISLSHNDHRSWFLHIRNAHEADRGWYMCQINTDPMRSRVGYIQVVVPPIIIDQETSADMVVREGSNVTLVCKAEGYPEPYVMWRREDGEDINYNGRNVNVIDGEVMTVTKVSRLHMGAYLCIASNGVPPSISKRVLLRVQFPPMLWIQNQLEGAYLGQDVNLECHTEAYPNSINFWMTERGDMIVSGDKYETIVVENKYKRYMMLKIRNVSARDFGSYKCMAKNSLGETDGVIKLDEIPAPPTTTTTTAAPTSSASMSTHKKKAKGKGKNIRIWDNHRKSDTMKNGAARGDYEVEEWRDREYDGMNDPDLQTDDEASLLSFGHAVKPSSAQDSGCTAIWTMLAMGAVYWTFH